MSTSWFIYNSGINSNPMSYTSHPSTPSCPNPNERLCAIFAEVQLIDGLRKPIITPGLQTQITTAVNNLTETADVMLCPE